MSFIQVIELRTTELEQLRALRDQSFEATEGKRTVRRSIITPARTHPDRYLLIVFFDSYESAMENSSLPETVEFAEKQQALLNGPLTFHDLDVIDERS